MPNYTSSVPGATTRRQQTPQTTSAPAASVAAQPSAQPLQQTQLRLEDLQQPGLPTLNTLISQIQGQLNTLSGALGKTPLPAGADLGGSALTGLGAPTSPTDAVSLAHAQANYSAAAIAPQLESGSPAALKTYRALNSQQQQENYSNFLEGVLNTAPTANTSIIEATPPSGGSVTVTISAGAHLYVSGRQVTYTQRSDTLALPASFPITAISRSGNVVTATTLAPTGYTAGEGIAVNGVTDNSYDGSFVLTSVSGITLTWNQINADSSSSGGTVSTANVYYYFVSGNSHELALSQAFPADTQQNRVSVNRDGTVLIATITLNAGGLDASQSSAGATPPVVTNGVRLQLRL